MSVFIKGNLFDSDEIAEIFSLENQISKFLQVETALAQAQAKLKMIPEEAATKINEKAKLENVNLEEFNRQLEITGGHEIVAFLRAWKPSFEDNSAEYIHWGATTQDIKDTTEVLRLKEVYEVIKRDLLENRKILLALAKKYKDTPIPGRTHGQQAVPTTFGIKVAVWIMEINRHLERLEECKKRLFYGSYFGAVGNLASVGPVGLSVKDLMMEYLGLAKPIVSWHTARDGFAEFLSILTMISSTFGKIANEVVTLSRTEFAEVEEPWKEGNVGSSTMPQKRNPSGSEKTVALSRVVQSLASGIYQCMNQEHERDSRVWAIEFFTIPVVCKLTAKILMFSKLILKDLVVYPENMKRNLSISKGLLLSESLMMQLGKKIGRLEAHEVVYQLAMKAYQEKAELKDLALKNSLIREHLSNEEIEACFQPENYIGASVEIVDNVLNFSDKLNF